MYLNIIYYICYEFININFFIIIIIIIYIVIFSLNGIVL